MNLLKKRLTEQQLHLEHLYEEKQEFLTHTPWSSPVWIAPKNLDGSGNKNVEL